jgi:hypothetical protein
LKLLLDVHHSRLAAQQLRALGHDLTAAADDPELASAPDDELLRAATRAGRALVAEHAKDFDRIARAWAAGGEHHAGIVFTSSRRYRRACRSYPADLVTGLATLLADPPADRTDLVHWLE